ncbi:MAG: M48 family peptidase, partial [Bacteroidota bacterium]|nr:M48 family peptidase [Bacteroidota bacterium]
MNPKKYNNIKLTITITKAIISFFLIFLFVSLGYSQMLEQYLSRFTSNSYFVFILFVIFSGLISGILFLPVNYYSEFYLEHKYKLSNQTLGAWIWEGLKELLVSAIVGIP